MGPVTMRVMPGQDPQILFAGPREDSEDCTRTLRHWAGMGTRWAVGRQPPRGRDHFTMLLKTFSSGKIATD